MVQYCTVLYCTVLYSTKVELRELLSFLTRSKLQPLDKLLQLHQLFKVTFKSKIIINNREMLNMRRCIFITILLVIFIVNTYPLLKTIHRSYSKLMLSMNSEKITIQPITSFTGRVRIYLYAYMI